jgi:OOP family OmpA-OmpF porin
LHGVASQNASKQLNSGLFGSTIRPQHFKKKKGKGEVMRGKLGRIVGYLVLLCCLAVGSVYGRGDGGKVKIRGLITTRTGETLTVKTQDGGTVTVVLTDDTKVQQPKGLGLRKKQMSAAVLIPGLKISVDGVGDAQSMTAATINFNQDDLQLAETIQAGLTPTQQQVQASQQKIKANQKDIQANQQGVQKNAQQIGANQEQIAANVKDIEDTSKRFSELSEYEVKGDATVNFAVASSVISATDKDALTKLAHDAVNLTGYIIEVKGYADSSGNAAMNQTLSMDRAQAVIAYLMQDCNVPVRHIVAPGAMGTSDPTATNETAQGRAENRRVEVKVLVNRGLAGK